MTKKELAEKIEALEEGLEKVKEIIDELVDDELGELDE